MSENKEKNTTAHIYDNIEVGPTTNATGIAESGESYLEAIYILKERKNGDIVRAIDLANELNFTKASVSRALSNLKEKDLVLIEDNGNIVFTKLGHKEALKIFQRHQLLTIFLKHIANVDIQIAEHDACRIEHVISNEAIKGIKEYLKKEKLI